MNIKKIMQTYWRAKRMQAFQTIMPLYPGIRIIDLGGTPEIWQNLAVPATITLFNLPEISASWPLEISNQFEVISGDACDAGMFANNSFDLVFSNSVIEHLPEPKQVDFALEVKRLAPMWWIQTPSIMFPIEAHCNLPFWWYYPRTVKQWQIAKWRRNKRYFIANQMETTVVLTKQRLFELFGESKIFTESFVGFEKSLCIYHT